MYYNLFIKINDWPLLPEVEENETATIYCRNAGDPISIEHDVNGTFLNYTMWSPRKGKRIIARHKVAFFPRPPVLFLGETFIAFSLQKGECIHR